MTDLRRPGRPRSETARAAILDAAVAELQDKNFAAMTVDGIAARAGVGKQTIYRWWPSKADVVLEAIIGLAADRVAVPDEGSLHADLVSFLSATFRQRAQRPVLVGLMAQAVLDPVFGEKFRDQFLTARRAVLRSLLQRAVVRGEVAADVGSGAAHRRRVRGGVVPDAGGPPLAGQGRQSRAGRPGHPRSHLRGGGRRVHPSVGLTAERHCADGSVRRTPEGRFLDRDQLGRHDAPRRGPAGVPA